MESLKIVTVGDGSVGKTSLLMAYTTNSYSSDYVITVFDNYQANVMYNDKTLTLNLWDTAGQEEYERLRPLSYPHTNVFILCFSVISPSSFLNVQTKWIPEIKHYCRGVPIILVGTKIDLREDIEILEKLKEKGLNVVSREEGEKMVKELRLASYIECSAKTRDGLKNLFDKAIQIGLEEKLVIDKPEKKRCNLL